MQYSTQEQWDELRTQLAESEARVLDQQTYYAREPHWGKTAIQALEAAK